MRDKPTPPRLRFDPDTRRIGVLVGKVELGQHVHSAHAQMVADALGVAPRHVVVIPVTTTDSPDDGMTVGSMSIQVTGVQVEEAVRGILDDLHRAAGLRLNADPDGLVLDPERLVFESDEGACDLFDVLPDSVRGAVDAAPSSRIDAAIRGRADFIQDIVLPGMRHARALRGRDGARVRGQLSKGLTLVEAGGFAAVLTDDPDRLASFWKTLDDPDTPGTNACDGPVQNWIKSARLLSSGDPPRDVPNATTVQASRPFILHGSVAPACGLAQMRDGTLTVWTHSQGIFPLRAQIARSLGLDPSQVECSHVPSAGCYGHTAADDAAMDAALIAMHRPGEAIRVTWPRQDELWFGPVGAPMLVEAQASVDKTGQITAWSQEVWSGPHGQRPGGGGHVNLLAAMEQDSSLRPHDIADLPPALGHGAARNAHPIYALPDVTVTSHIAQDLPVRSSSLRGLGTQTNTIAIEAMMDRLADQTGQSRFDFRSRHLDDPRAKTVLNALQQQTETARAQTEGSEDTAIGIALGRYKNKAAYAAVAVALTLEDRPRLTDVWAVVDAGRVISADGTLNQIEGGILQAASWTLWEGAMLRDGRIDLDGWEDYPTLPWTDVPALHVTLIDQPAAPPLGVGECMVGPTAAAIVNAASDLAGQTLADLPLDSAAFLSALS